MLLAVTQAGITGVYQLRITLDLIQLHRISSKQAFRVQAPRYDSSGGHRPFMVLLLWALLLMLKLRLVSLQ